MTPAPGILAFRGTTGFPSESAAMDEDGHTSAALVSVLYSELRRLAHAWLARRAPGESLQTTVLVHEAYLRLAKPGCGPWDNRGHFFGAAARSMQRILVDHARRRRSLKRGGDRLALELREEDAVHEVDMDRLLALNDALGQLESLDARAAEVVKLRWFAGLTNAEAAEALGVGRRTVQRDWATARAWLEVQMAGTQTDGR